LGSDEHGADHETLGDDGDKTGDDHLYGAHFMLLGCRRNIPLTPM
jgi:hypothetical protein